MPYTYIVRVKVTPKNIFLLVALLLTTVTCSLTYFIAYNNFEEFVVENHTDNDLAYVNGLSLEYFDFTKTTSLKNAGEPENFIKSLLRNSDIIKAKITDANGVVLASSNPSEIGLALHDDTSWEIAIGGDKKVDNLDENKANLYLPLTSSNDIVKGVVIMETFIADDLVMVQKLTATVMYVVLGTSIFFILIAYLIMYELEEKMEANERSIFDKSRAQTEEKQLYEAITTSIAEALAVINKDKQILMFNTEAEKLIGAKSSAVEYRSYEKIINFYDESKRKIKKDPIKEALEKGQIIHISSKDGYHLKAGSGDLVPVAVNIAPVAEGKSFVKGVAVTIIDISTEKELQKVKDEFVYVVAHELGNPIFALDGYLSLMEGREKALGRDGKEILSSAQGINRQLSSLVNDLLEVARNETGRLTFDMEKINLGNILAEVIKNSEFRAREKNIKLVFKNKKAPLASGNERKIKEVATNLVDNAIKYTRKGGTVEVDVFQHENRVIVEIKDNGVGISPENQKHLFEKFYRVKNKATEGISGTGLGLFIAKQIVEKCGGKIWATSEEDKGSVFYFSLKTTK